MALTDAEKAKALYHMGYPDNDRAFQAHGFVAHSYEYYAFASKALDTVNSTSEARVRVMLQTLEGIEAQIVECIERMQVTKLGDIQTNQAESDQLEKQAARWGRKLAELVGCEVNPDSSRFGSGVNIPVRW